MRVLGIETSCDETAAAVYEGGRGLLAHAVHSQAAVHAEYGGVVPELASRDHIRKLIPLVDQVLVEAGLSGSAIDGVAYTAGPGLAGALLVGAAVGRSLAFAWDVPAVAVHHLEAHLLAPMLEEDPPETPFLALLVSGGHTQLVSVDGIGEYRLLGDTLDDAAGEAFDKTATLLGLPYPGGPALARLAEQGRTGRLRFPRPMTDRPGLDFSFSGLKTHTRTLWESHALEERTEQLGRDIAAGFQRSVVDTLAIKCRRAMKQTRHGALVVSGGVGANLELRAALRRDGKKHGWTVAYPRIEFCTDNGAMIAFAGYQRLVAGESEDEAISARPRWPLAELGAATASETVP